MVKAAVCSKTVVLLLLYSLLLPLWDSVTVLCFVVRSFVSIVFQLYLWGKESWLLCLVCRPGVL